MANRIFSSGGGRQSIGVLALCAIANRIKVDPSQWQPFKDKFLSRTPTLTADEFIAILDFPIHIFANVGDDSENPDTLAYIRDYARPFAEQNGIQYIELQPKKRTLRQHVMQSKRSVPLPIVLQPKKKGASPAHGNRSCTTDYKIKPLDRYVRKDLKFEAYTVGIGFSTDEWHRATNAKNTMLWRTPEYPLLTLRLSATDCQKIIEFVGLPIPPKSACFFCPFQKRERWQELHDQQPWLYADAVAMEQYTHANQAACGKPLAYFSKTMIPLAELVVTQQTTMDVALYETCDSGGCMT